ncbi:nucleoside-diphosphate-sugar epimerase [Rhizobium sp. BK529]|nr:nucleoside-diphosphate-sugar epimerase [Rhizobium sp. BK529]
MRYLWKKPLRMSNAKLVAELGCEPQTPIDEAVRASLVALGCLSRTAGLLPNREAIPD